MKRALISRALLSIVATVAGAGCTNETDTSQNVLPWLSEREIVDTTTTTAPDATGACDCLAVGSWYRFDALAITGIDGKEHPVIPTLNTLWQTDIDALELDIMIEVVAVSPTSVTTRVMNGARVDGSQVICKLDDTAVEVVFPRDGCRLEASNESAFNVYAGTETYPKNCSTTLPVQHAIPVSKARLEGTLSEDCAQILTGKVPSGGLGEVELGQICTCLTVPGDPAEKCGLLEPGYTTAPCVGCNANYQPLAQLLQAFGQVDWLCTTEDGGRAACLTADFTARLMDAAPASCGE
ncbi:MAG: hypothetical protein IT385_00965 [Deltaproteobacteria bacterium]|nr:hypothetical protein [Deltaproteobacteria bacterium]